MDVAGMFTPRRQRKTRRPFARKPKTREFRAKDGSIRRYRIEAAHLSPLLVRIADRTARISAGALAFGGAYLAFNAYLPGLIAAVIRDADRARPGLLEEKLARARARYGVFG